MADTTSRWAILTVICLCMLSYALVMQSIPPVMSLIIEQLRISHHQGGMLMSLFALPGIVVSLPAGMLADRYGMKRVGTISLLLTIAGTFMVATGETFMSVLAGRIVAGAGAISLVIISPQAIAQWFRNREVGVAMGIFNTMMPVGVIVSLNVIPVLASRWGWRSGIWAAAAFAVTALIVFALFFGPPRGETAGQREMRPSARNPGRESVSIGLVALSWALFNASIISLFTFAPDFMVDRGRTLGSAGFDTSLVMIGSLTLSPIIGYAVDRVRHQELFIAAGGLGMAMLLLLVPVSKSLFPLLMVAIGISASLVPAPVYSLAAYVASQKRLGLGFGILSMLNNAGVFVGPQLVGLSRDVSGSYRPGFHLMALFAVLSTVTATVLWMRRRRQSARLDCNSNNPR